MNQKQRDDILNTLVKGQSEMQDDLKEVKRGVYGDKKNKQLGLLDRQEKDEEKFEVYQKQMLAMNSNINTNTRFRKKAGKAGKWLTGGGATATVATLIANFKQIKQSLLAFFE